MWRALSVADDALVAVGGSSGRWALKGEWPCLGGSLAPFPVHATARPAARVGLNTRVHAHMYTCACSCVHVCIACEFATALLCPLLLIPIPILIIHHTSIHLSISSTHPTIYLFIHQSVHPSLYLSISIHLSTHHPVSGFRFPNSPSLKIPGSARAKGNPARNPG